MKFIASTLVVLMLVLAVSCQKDRPENFGTLKKLYKQYKNGEIDECTYQGATVFVAGQNAYDAGSNIYDHEGNVIGNCNYAWGNVDSICGQLKDCEVIYRCDNHITGEPPVDKYGLK